MTNCRSDLQQLCHAETCSASLRGPCSGHLSHPPELESYGQAHQDRLLVSAVQVAPLVQKSIQLAFQNRTEQTKREDEREDEGGNDGEPDKENAGRGHHFRSIRRSLAAARRSGLIDKECSECIVAQFEDRIPIPQQRACGTIIAPTESCAQSGVTTQQVQTAAILALGAAPIEHCII